MTQLPSVPGNATIEYQRVIYYTNLFVPQTTFSYVIVGIPQNYVVCGTVINLLQTFTGPTLSSLTCSLGAFVPNTILTDITYYGMALELTQLPTSRTIQASGPSGNNLNYLLPYAPSTGLYFNGPHDVSAYFTSKGTNLGNLTAGAVELTVYIRPL